MALVDDEVSRGTQLLLSSQAEVAAGIDGLFDQLLAVPSDPRGPLYEAMRHAAVAGGKRLRPLLVRAAGDLFHVDRALTLRVGAAVEAMHVYSLIHDDLPCMDDDDLRRGRATLHRAFDEAT
ncbi:MAG TPA: polyprenyl synthetase family protein, partial [Sphingopyxis sp.]|nr:polyprenyl synthetase family protein [Sphingopyxis sp.]